MGYCGSESNLFAEGRCYGGEEAQHFMCDENHKTLHPFFRRAAKQLLVTADHLPLSITTMTIQ